MKVYAKTVDGTEQESLDPIWNATCRDSEPSDPGRTLGTTAAYRRIQRATSRTAIQGRQWANGLALFGTDPLRVTALGVSQAPWNSYGTNDSVMTIIEYAAGPNGVPGLAQTHDAFTVPYPGTSMEIHGSDGAIIIGDAMTQDTPGTVILRTDAGDETIEVDCSEDLYHINVRSFADSLRGEGRPTATGADGLIALQVALAAEESLDKGRTVALT